MQITGNHAALFAALARAQAKFPPIPKTRTIEVRLKSGGGYRHEYAELPDIIGAVRRALTDEGLCYADAVTTREGKSYLVSMLGHAEGGALTAEVELPAVSNAQELGIAMTYRRRYQIQAMLCVAAEDEPADGGGSDREVTRSERREPPARPPSERPAPPDLATADLRAAISAEFDRLNIPKPERGVICLEVTGERAATLSQSGAGRLLLALRERVS